MDTTTETFNALHPRAAAGRFDVKGQSRPEVTVGSAFHELAPSDHEVNDSFPIPQANDLDKLAAVVDVVAAGANTGAAAAETFELSDRQGPYYLDAAGYLGLVDTVPGADVRTYELTMLGQKMLASDWDERMDILRHVVAGVPAVQVYLDGGHEAMQEYLTDGGLGDGTAERRGASASSWLNALTRDADFAHAMSCQVENARERSIEAAVHAAEAQAARSLAKREVVPASCGGCFMVLPSSGICGC
jgi:hypothetical protein